MFANGRSECSEAAPDGLAGTSGAGTASDSGTVDGTVALSIVGDGVVCKEACAVGNCEVSLSLCGPGP